jgi:hypothetical protein
MQHVAMMQEQQQQQEQQPGMDAQPAAADAGVPAQQQAAVGGEGRPHED